MTSFPSPEALLQATGTDLGVSSWIEVDQTRIDRFADATDDQQWIHVDQARAATGPFGGTIAHGYLTLSLVAPLLGELLHVDGVALVVNAGSDRVRFITPVRSGARVRARGTLQNADATERGVRTRAALTVEVEGVDSPALVAEIITLFVPS